MVLFPKSKHPPPCWLQEATGGWPGRLQPWNSTLISPPLFPAAPNPLTEPKLGFPKRTWFTPTGHLSNNDCEEVILPQKEEETHTSGHLHRPCLQPHQIILEGQSPPHPAQPAVSGGRHPREVFTSTSHRVIENPRWLSKDLNLSLAHLHIWRKGQLSFGNWPLAQFLCWAPGWQNSRNTPQRTGHANGVLCSILHFTHG